MPYPDNPRAIGMAQLTDMGIDMAFGFAPPIADGSSTTWADPWIQQAYIWTKQSGLVLKNVMGQKADPTKYRTYQLFYANLDAPSQTLLRSYFPPIINGLCDAREVQAHECDQEGVWREEEWRNNLVFGMDVLLSTERALAFYVQYVKRKDTRFWKTFWEALPEEERWKVRIATYNAGQACIGDAIVYSGGHAQSWKEIVSYLDWDNCSSAWAEVEHVWNYLQKGGP